MSNLKLHCILLFLLSLHILFYHIIQHIHCCHFLLIYNLCINQSGSQALMPHQFACRIDVGSFCQEQGGKGSVPNLFEGLILPYFCLYLASACKINKKLKFTTLLQQIYNRNQQNKPSSPFSSTYGKGI